MFRMFKKLFGSSQSPQPSPQQFQQPITLEEDEFDIDACEAHIDSVFESLDLASDDPLLYAYAGNHMALFMAWLAARDFLVTDLGEPDEAAIARLKRRELTGTAYLLDYRDGQFHSADVDQSLLSIIRPLYKDYLSHYAAFLPDDEPICARLFSWADYDQLAPQIDELYHQYQG